MLLCMLQIPLRATAGDSEFSQIKHYFSNILAYRNLPQEKVYLQLDNNGYFPGEKIWFKAYVFRAGTLLPTNMSKILYVELRTPDGNLWERKTLPIYNGRTYGDFDLTYLFRSGFYEVRAYTRAMLNWDAAYVYSRMVPVFRECADSINYNQLQLEPYDVSVSAGMRRLAPQPLLSPEAQKQKECILSFYPEGGHIVSRLASRVAFRLTDGNGMPLRQSFTLFDREGREVLQARPEHDGMGSFILSPRWEGGYAEVVDSGGKASRFALPAARGRGCTLSAAFDDSLRIHVEAGDSLDGQLLGVSVTCRGVACFFDTLRAGGGRQTLTVSRRQLREGVEQVTLFTASGEVLAERLVWVPPMQTPLIMEVRQNQTSYAPFAPIVLSMALKDHEGKPLKADFSLSVQDRNGIIAGGGTDLRTDMLLCSDLKGYIHDPQWYFSADDEQHRRALDLLMMVQGWRRYEWREMAGIDTFRLQFPVEDVQVIDGTVVDWSNRKKPVPHTDVNLMLLDVNGYHKTSFAFTKTDSLGRFSIQLKDTLYDACYAYLSATKNDKRKRYAFVLNRGFHPVPRAAEPYELKLEPPLLLRKLPAVSRPAETFQWTDTLPKIHYLPTAKVTERNKALEQPFGTRWSFMGGELAARGNSTIYYNMEEETQDWLDKGNYYVPNIWEWFASINKKFYYDPNNPDDMMWYGRHIQLVYDNRPDPPLDSISTIDELRAFYISSDPLIYSRITGKPSNSDAVTFLLYSEVGNNFINTLRKGERTTVIRGYSRVDEFYSPDYRRTDMPSLSDHRRTLYWNPEMVTDENGKADVLFYNNFRDGTQLYIDAQGIAVNGEMFSNHH